MKPFEEKIRYIDLLEKFIATNHHILSRDFQNIPAEIAVYIKNKSKYKDEDDYARQVLLSHYPEMFFQLERLYYALAENHRPLDPKHARFLRYQVIPDIAKNLLSLHEQPNGQNWLKNIFNRLEASSQAKKRDLKVLAFSFWSGLNVYEIGFELEKALPDGWNFKLIGMSFIPDHLAASKNAIFPASVFPPGYIYKDNFVKEGETYQLPQNRIGNIDFQLVRIMKEDSLILKDKVDLVVLWGANQFYSLPVIHRIIEKCIPLLEPGGIIIPGIQQFDDVQDFDACDILWVDKQFYYRRNNSAIVQKLKSSEGESVNDETPDNLYTFAMAQLLKGDHKRVLDYTHLIFKKRVDHRDTIILKSIAQIDMDDLAGALHTIQQALMINANDFDACLIKSYINLKRNKIRDAERELHRAINHFNFNKLYNIIPIKPSDEQLFFARWLKIENMLKKMKADQKNIPPEASEKEEDLKKDEPGPEMQEFNKREQMKEYQKQREAKPEKPIIEVEDEVEVKDEDMDEDQGTVSIIRDIEEEKLTEKVLPGKKEKAEPKPKEIPIPQKAKKTKKTDKAPETVKLIETVVAETLEKELSGKIREKQKAKEKKSQEALETSEAQETPEVEKHREFTADAFKVVDIKKPPKAAEEEIKPITPDSSDNISLLKPEEARKKTEDEISGKTRDQGKVLKVFISGDPADDGIMEEILLTENLTPTEILRRDSLPESGMLEEFSRNAQLAKPPFGKIRLPRRQETTASEVPAKKTPETPMEPIKAEVEKATSEKTPVAVQKKSPEKPVGKKEEKKEPEKYSYTKPEELITKEAETKESGDRVRHGKKAAAGADSAKPAGEAVAAPSEKRIEKISSPLQKAEPPVEEELKAISKTQEDQPPQQKAQTAKAPVKSSAPGKAQPEKAGMPQMAFKTIEEILGEFEQPGDEMSAAARADKPEESSQETVPVPSPKAAMRRPVEPPPAKKAVKPKKLKREDKSFKTKELLPEDGQVSSEVSVSGPEVKPHAIVTPQKAESFVKDTPRPPSPRFSRIDEDETDTAEIENRIPPLFDDLAEPDEELISSGKKEKTEFPGRKKTAKISQEKIQSGEIDIEALLMKDRESKSEGEVPKVGIIIEDTDTREIKRAYMINAKEIDSGRKTREIIRVDLALAKMEEKLAEKSKDKKGKPREIIRYVKEQNEEKKFYETR